MINKSQKINMKKNGGSLLLELLIVISLLGVILSISANATFLSMRSNKVSGERDVASALATESLEAVRVIADESWKNIYTIPKGVQYYPTINAGTWELTQTGKETKNLNTASYQRYVVIEDVCRDQISRDISGVKPLLSDCAAGSTEDPSTQKVTVTVEWTGGNPIVISEYFYRWKNKISNQNNWSGASTLPTINACSNTTNGCQDGKLNISGPLQLN